jgi:hypothetical protein
MASSQALLANRRAAATALTADLRRVFGPRLRALVAYGVRGETDGDAWLHTLALVEGMTFDDLAACAPATAGWKRLRVAIPLLISLDEFRRTLDVFPLEYDHILTDHVVIEGEDPFEGIRVAESDLRRACEVQAKSHLIHLREGFLEGSREPRAIAALIASSAPAFRSLLIDIARLDRKGGHAAGEIDRSDEAIANAAQQTIGLPADVVRDVLSAERATSTAVDPTALLARYIDAAAQVWRYVDRWRSA